MRVKAVSDRGIPTDLTIYSVRVPFSTFRHLPLLKDLPP
jgi:hypothetical protein